MHQIRQDYYRFPPRVRRPLLPWSPTASACSGMSRSFSEGPDNRSRKDREFGGIDLSIVGAWFSGAGNVRSSRLGRRIEGVGRGSLATTLMFEGLVVLLAAPRMLSA